MTIRNPLDLEKILGEVFETEKVEYYKRGIPFRGIGNGNLIYFIECEKITPEINAKWSRLFHNGSYYGIGKESTGKQGLHLILDVTDDDLNEVQEN